MAKKHIGIIGDGGWGTALAILLYGNGYEISVWGAFPDYIKTLDKIRENTKFLPGIKIPKGIRLTSTSQDLFGDIDIHLISVPSQHLRGVLQRFKGSGIKKVVCTTKGIENGSLKRPSEIIAEFFANSEIACLSGPSISYEVARGLPTTVVAASKNSGLALEVQGIFTNEQFRVYTSDDVIGVELGGALKNIVAIAAGISDGLGFGTNTKAGLLTRGLVEIYRLGESMGARRSTFFGLSGLGDLATTCMSTHSRNRWLGEEIAKGRTLREILSSTEMVIEGVATAEAAWKLAQKYKVEMPITEKIYEVLYENKDPKEAVRELMTRPPKWE